MPQPETPETNSNSYLSSNWISTAELCKAWKCSRYHLQTLREQRILKPRVHYKNISPYAARPTYRYHKGRCEKALEIAEEGLTSPSGDVEESEPILEAIALAEPGKLDPIERMK